MVFRITQTKPKLVRQDKFESHRLVSRCHTLTIKVKNLFLLELCLHICVKLMLQILRKTLLNVRLFAVWIC